MINLPAICDKCGMVFNSGIVGGGGATITMVNSKAGPCPNCGAMGSIPDGTYRLIENVIEVLSDPQRTIKELEKLSETLEKAQRRKYSRQQLEEEINKKAPELSSITELLPKTREEKRSDIKFFIKSVLTALSIIIPIMSSNTSGNSPGNVQPEQVINQMYYIENQYNIPLERHLEKIDNQNKKKPIKVDKIGRNEPCHCGSGLKYKKCHWPN